ncbi:MAG: MBOAT family protein [Lachnospiraceae bacterium]|nr:MBOAT family protein [Lachnospiraceae bacterium]
MLFSSIEFLFRFLPVFMLIYLLVPEKYRNFVLLSGSLVFYGVGEPYYVLLLVFSILINYGLGRLILNDKLIEYKLPFLVFTLIVDFGLLFIFKYQNFVVENINKLVSYEAIPVLDLVLPLGISFYTFQTVSYLIDCYRGKIKKAPSLIEFAVYVSMFPQLIAGPIVKFDEVSEKLKKRRISAGGLENGLKRFSIGLGYKVLLANQIGTLWNTIMTAGAGNLSAPVAWLGAFAYSFQIYFDFWGYSLMAKGLGEMLGFRLPKNFDNPYASKSISEFWRRWHITLGRWFKEYLYIPMGGNRKGFVRTSFNLLIVWAFTGLWHGAGWNFLLWGLAFFVIISIEKSGIGKWLEKSKILGHIYVIAVIPITWVIFAITDIGQLGMYLQNMFGIHTGNVMVGNTQLFRYIKEYGVLFILCMIFATPYPMRLYRGYKNRWLVILIVAAVFWFSVYEIMVGSNNPFLYFRF